jgi:ABC-type multidrug transport system fused ATPase/permease subunit
MFYFFQRIYTAASVQIRRHETATKSPIYSQFGETISGTSTIRAYNQQERFIAESADCIDDHKRSQYTSAATSR